MIILMLFNDNFDTMVRPLKILIKICIKHGKKFLFLKCAFFIMIILIHCISPFVFESFFWKK
jgi:hypothetical protein